MDPRRRLAAAPWWVHFVLISLAWAVLALLLAVATGRAEFAVLALAAPVYGGAMTAIVLRGRRSQVDATGLPAERIYDLQRAARSGVPPADRAAWPELRKVVTERRAALPRARRLTVRVGGMLAVGFLVLAVLAAATGHPAGAVLPLAAAALFGGVVATTLVGYRREGERLDRLERAMDAG